MNLRALFLAAGRPLLRLAFALSITLVLTHCGGTVKAKRISSEEAWRDWRKDSEWKRQYAEAMARAKANGFDRELKNNPEGALATIRDRSAKQPELHSAVAIFAAELAQKREAKGDSAGARGFWLASAEGAYYTVKETEPGLLRADRGAPGRFMVDLYNRAVERFVALDFAAGNLRGKGELPVAGPGVPFKVALRNLDPGGIKVQKFDEMIPTSDVKVPGLSTKGTLPGVGATFSGVIRRTPERERELKFTGKRGLNLPVTALVDFPDHPVAGQPARAEVMLLDPTVRREVPFRGKLIPVSRDCSTPLALEVSGLNPRSLGLGGFLRVEDHMKMAGLYMLQPYDPNRIPVLMIHGLQSSPLIWRDMIAELQADPEISAHYQFWVMYYPSGMAIPYSRRLVVNQLKAVRENFDPQETNLASRNMVAIGHSMGGVLSRSLITDVGDRFWKAISKKDFDQMQLTAEQRKEVRGLVFFKPVPEVKRALFFSAPHRGAKMADSWIGRIGSALVRLPGQLVKVPMAAITLNSDNLRDPESFKRGPNSIRSLSPGAPIYEALNQSPFVRGVPYHSVVGDRGKGDTPNSSDGIVAYWSSHLEGAESELIVPTGHGSYVSPLSVEETKRILRKHLRGR